jgi:uncharacterized paraquat-inducible protein A
VLAASGSSIVNGVLLASAVVPPIVVIVLAWVFLRAGRRNDERERAAAQGSPTGRSPSSSAQ